MSKRDKTEAIYKTERKKDIAARKLIKKLSDLPLFTDLAIALLYLKNGHKIAC